MAGIPIQYKNEPSKYPRREYITGAWRVQLDYNPRGNYWSWMMETHNPDGSVGPVWWHKTDGPVEPSYENIKNYIKAAKWSGEEYKRTH